jgi:hypothetical protein
MQNDFIHTIKVTQLTVEDNFNDFNNVVVHCRWSLETYHKDFPDTVECFSGAVPFKVSEIDLQESFINFEELTEDQVASWIPKNVVSFGMYKKNNIEKLTEILFSKKTVIENPWQDKNNSEI